MPSRFAAHRPSSLLRRAFTLNCSSLSCLNLVSKLLSRSSNVVIDTSPLLEVQPKMVTGQVPVKIVGSRFNRAAHVFRHRALPARPQLALAVGQQPRRDGRPAVVAAGAPLARPVGGGGRPR